MKLIHPAALLAPLLLISPVLAFTDCIGQGSGNCQFVMSAFEPSIGDKYYDVTLYDHSCNIIGQADNIGSGSIFSQLPYTVDIVDRGGEGTGDNGVYATFWYAGGEYGMGHGDYARGIAILEMGSVRRLGWRLRARASRCDVEGTLMNWPGGLGAWGQQERVYLSGVTAANLSCP